MVKSLGVILLIHLPPFIQQRAEISDAWIIVLDPEQIKHGDSLLITLYELRRAKSTKLSIGTHLPVDFA